GRGGAFSARNRARPVPTPCAVRRWKWSGGWHLKRQRVPCWGAGVTGRGWKEPPLALWPWAAKQTEGGEGGLRQAVLARPPWEPFPPRPWSASRPKPSRGGGEVFLPA